MKLGELGELGLLAALGLEEGPVPAGWVGPGDDAAVIPSPGANLLFTSDLLVEGVHFRLATTTPRDLGYKALAVNVSDAAAMGGRPLAFTVSLACPPDRDSSWVEALYEGLREAAGDFGCVLAGGDTSAAPLVFLSIALVGTLPDGGAILRSGARPGDDLYITGSPGESALGLHLLEAGLPLSTPARSALVARHRRPEPRTALGAALGEGHLATALIDVSDGLLRDLGHILTRSGVGAALRCEDLPVSAALAETAGELGQDVAGLVLSGGEDYELLFTAMPRAAEALRREAERCGTPLHRIGSVEGEPGIRLLRDGVPVPLPESRGFDHFGPKRSRGVPG